ncbi:G-type lectin S-receptor-like serine/threonine-protein kinase At4g27290 isoform X1 [Humulus lupulus]|uniref:G-type lectin S-receptor-like serine/threonine-protein kinase At4g27290 isoform X1 n=1 Tax=Humulus lupulus TaxID=3486 RepID=UPI002B40B324|nr:G-type lectin S-receptor-like serine/threonine-protein kinase At4g27290 isoform X1 [Humulus lupulus]
MSLKIMEFLSFMVTFVVLRLSLCRTTLASLATIRPSEFMRDNTTLVSTEGLFELGFFSPGSSKNHYLGIWYKNISVQTVVWVANRCEPINDSSGSLTIDDTGNLVLYGQNKMVVWSTNSTKQAREPLVQLLDNGNLVLRDEKDENTENYLWESFDYPTDMNLPGSKFGWDLRRGLNRRLSAWKSWDDPCDGDLTYGIELDERHHTYPQLIIRKGSAKFYRIGSWNGIRFSGYPEVKRENTIFDYGFVYNDDEVYYVYDLKGKSVISKMVMNETSVITRGVLNQTKRVGEVLVWIESKKIWETNSSVPKDECDVYGICGANSVCVITNNPVCQCLKSFKPKNQENWKERSWSEGCVRNNPLNCHDKEKDGFIRFSNLKVPDTEYTWVNKSMDLEECRVKCLSNCSCMAYTNLDIREKGSGCVLWFGDLFDIREYQLGGQDIYIRMLASEIVNHEKARTDRKVKVERALIITAIIVGLVGGMFLVGFYIRRRIYSYETNESQNDDLELPLFDLHTIDTATNYFSENNKLGEGGFGPVYKGTLEGGQEIAVKRLSMSSGQGVDEFKNEIKLIAKLQHRNLVKIFGYCIDREMKLLIYEYMSNKSLDYFIFDERKHNLLEWPTRFQIVCGIAKGLLYLHHDSRLRIIHRDLKASNILLDEDMNPKISDFGLARSFGGEQIEGNTNKIVGTYGYLAPEYASNGLFSTKSDVFSFGTLMLEIVSGKKSRGLYDEDSILNLTGLAWTLMKEGNAFMFIDKCLLRDPNDNMEEALRCIHIGLLCVQQKPIDRPNMSSVILMLSGEKVLPQPKPPAYFTNTDLWEGYHSPFSKTPSCNTSITAVEAR